MPAGGRWPLLGMRSVFALLGLLVLLLAGAGLVLFRVYDNQLIRQTEAELIAQGTSLASIYRQALLAELARQPEGTAAALAGYGNEIDESLRDFYDPGQPLRPMPARLSLGIDTVRPPAEPPRHPEVTPDAVARAAGVVVEQVLRETKRTTLAGIRIVDYRGTVVAASNLKYGQSLAHHEEVARALHGEMVSLFRRRVSDHPPPPYSSLSRETGVRVFVALPVVADSRVLGAVVLSRTPMTLGKAFYQDRFSLLGTAGILVVTVLAVSLLVAALIVRPVRALIRQTKAIAAGVAEGSQALIHPGTREIAQLSRSFADMASRLARRTEYIKGFAASVSHEFKTPLSAIAGTVELLRDHGAGMTTEERERFLANLTADTRRLSDLVHRVLELARADMLQPGDVHTDVGEAVGKVVTSCRDMGVKVEATGPARAGLARLDGETLVAILKHLADNARQHGGPDVTLRIAIKAEAEARAAVIEISDDGPGISEANRARVFAPFFTTARDRGGTGMGLTIARALLQAHGGALELVPSEKGARFRLTVPA